MQIRRVYHLHGGSMRTTLTIDDEALAEAVEASGGKTKTAVSAASNGTSQGFARSTPARGDESACLSRPSIGNSGNPSDSRPSYR